VIPVPVDQGQCQAWFRAQRRAAGILAGVERPLAPPTGELAPPTSDMYDSGDGDCVVAMAPSPYDCSVSSGMLASPMAEWVALSIGEVYDSGDGDCVVAMAPSPYDCSVSSGMLASPMAKGVLVNDLDAMGRS